MQSPKELDSEGISNRVAMRVVSVYIGKYVKVYISDGNCVGGFEELEHIQCFKLLDWSGEMVLVRCHLSEPTESHVPQVSYFPRGTGLD